MHLTSLLCFIPLLSLVLADGAAIIASITDINNQLESFNQTVASIDGTTNPMPGISTIASQILSSINNGTLTAESSAPLTLLEAVTVAQAASTLVDNVKSTLTTIVNAKPQFEKYMLQMDMLRILEDEKAAADMFVNATIAKVPAPAQGTALEITTGLDPAFENAILAILS